MSEQEAEAAFQALWREVLAQVRLEQGPEATHGRQIEAAYYLLTGRDRSSDENGQAGNSPPAGL